MVPVQGGHFSAGSEAQALMSELPLHLHLLPGREEFAGCQLVGQPCWLLQGFLGSPTTPLAGEPEWAVKNHFLLIWICCALGKERFFRRDVLGNEFNSLLFV